LNLEILKTKCNSTEKVFVITLGLSILLLILNFYYSTTPSIYNMIIYILLILLFLILFFIAYVDFKTMEIDNWLSLGLMIVLLLINIFLYYYTEIESGLVISDTFSYIPYNNFYAALILGLPFFLTVLLTKEKALGGGDIRIAIITGLLIGKENLLTWLYITVFSALIYGLLLGYKKKSFKNLKIPFAPFIILGTVVSLLMDMYY